MYVPLILGNFQFDETELEVPETMGDLGGVQNVAQHDFPGGTRTHQSFGFFPEPIEWKARFTGPNASNRSEQVKRILVAGQEVQLSFGDRAWLGRLIKFSPAVRNQWLFDYELIFWPRQDISSGTPQPVGFSGASTLMSLNALAIQSMIDAADAGGLYANIASIVGVPVTTLLAAVSVGLVNAQGNTFALQAADQLAIGSAASTVLTACAPLQLSASPTISSPASDLASYVAVLNTLATASQQPQWQVNVTNPNLAVLAAQYYGDCTLWKTIATYNGLADPQPIGNFEILIPPPQ